jgi:Flp pilus assembly protein TadD
MNDEGDKPQNSGVTELLTAAQVAEGRGDFPAAVRSAKAAVELDPADWKAQMMLGLSLSRIGEHEAASAACFKAVELDMGSYAAWHAVGIVGARAKLFPQAEKSMKTALELARPGREKADVLTALGTLYTDSERPAEVEACFVQAITEGPQSIEPRANLFMHLVTQRQLEKAVSVADGLDELLKQRTTPLSELERKQSTDVLALRDDIRRDLKKLAEYRAKGPSSFERLGMRFELWASNWAVGRGLLIAWSFILRPFQR